jgi:hypothetical protein
MKEETEEKLLGMLEWVESAAKSGTEFLSEQTPLYIQELLYYYFWTSAAVWIFMGLLLIPMIYGVKQIYNMFNEGKEDDIRCVWFFVIISYLIFSPIVLYNNSDWIKIKLAPRVYVVDYVTEKLGK